MLRALFRVKATPKAFNLRFLSTTTTPPNPLDVSSIPLPNEDPALLGKQAKKNAAEAEPEEVDITKTPSHEREGFLGKIEYNGPKGPEPTRFGDYERNGRCYDF